MGHSKSSRREVYSNSGLPQETRQISNRHFNLTLKELGEKSSKLEEINKDQINKWNRELRKDKWNNYLKR